MKKLIPILFFTLTFGIITFGQTNKKNNQELQEKKLILQTEEEYRKAKVENDVQKMDAILADGYKGLNQFGVTTNKSQAKANWVSRKATLTLDTLSVTLESDTSATVRGLQTEDNIPMHFEHDFIKRDGKWLIVSVVQKMTEYKGTRGIGKYHITGQLRGADGMAVSLIKNNPQNGSLVNLNAAIVKNGAFTMEGEAIEYPQRVYLTTPGKRERTTFFLENAEIMITGNIDSLSKAKVTGSKTQDEYQTSLDAINVFRVKFESISKEMESAMQNKDTVRMNQIKKEIDALMSEVNSIQKDFVRNNPHSYACPVILQGLLNSQELSEFESLVNGLDPDVARTPEVIFLKKRISERKVVEIGRKAPDFTLNDVNGVPVTLSSKVGAKLLLIDFWAAWCAPCRKENPNVVKVYNEFKNKGFDIMGVSLDRKKEDWVQAIAKDNLTWTQVSDLLFWNSAAAKLYLVTSIPANFLLDKNGIIVAKNIRGEALAAKVKELLK
jgi:peroxiredoxin